MASTRASLACALVALFFVSHAASALGSAKIIFTAIALSDEAKVALLSAYPPLLENVYADHMTLVFMPKDDVVSGTPFGNSVNMTVFGYAHDEKCQAVAVDDHGGAESQNPITHVTISCSAGNNPVYSNDLLKKGFNQVNDGVVLTGRVGGCTKMNGAACAEWLYAKP
eukprot:Opistho-2@47670